MMMNTLESRLEEALERHAAQAGPVAFTADEILRVGRRARARRRGVAISASAAAVAAIAVVAVAVLPSSAPGPNPVGPASPSASPAPTSAAPTSPAPTSAAPVDYALGATIYPASGAPVPVPLPAGDTIFAGQRVPGGWVVQAEHDADTQQPSQELWWQPDGGAAVHLGRLWGGWQVSADGSVVVMAGKPTGIITAYHLPSAQPFATVTAFPDSLGPAVLATTDDHVLIHESTGSGEPTTAGVWDLTTGAVSYTSEPLHIWAGVSDTGQVGVEFTNGCLTVVDFVDLPERSPGGVCGQFDPSRYVLAEISADGQVLVSDGETFYLVRADDLAAGTWDPIDSAPLVVAGGFDFTGLDDGPEFYLPGADPVQLCDTLHSCTPVSLPVGAWPLLGLR